MNRPLLQAALVGACLLLAASSAVGCAPEPAGDATPACSNDDSDPTRGVDFATEIAPLLRTRQNGADNCTYCHDSTRPDLSSPVYLYLDTLAFLRKGSKASGPVVVVPGKPCSSLIVRRLRGTTGGAGERMPKNGPYFRPEQIQLVSDWIAEGAKGEDPK